MEPKKKYDPKQIGEIQFKLKDIYKTVAFIIGIVSMGIIYKEESKAATNEFRQDLSIQKAINENNVKDIGELKTRMLEMRGDYKVLQTRLDFGMQKSQVSNLQSNSKQ